MMACHKVYLLKMEYSNVTPNKCTFKHKGTSLAIQGMPFLLWLIYHSKKNKNAFNRGYV